ncbi:unnamed protein product [Prorocentrum cordatum]|uniref:Fatty acid hydroxylase domain-containing protein n=1 Tax=Prorocentrum cordatum TaxID=2364126 RepID=A0ABN9THU3_9DINO|nr:unnamed protein product [Polarella glacialis]|mmetsp:Transcript_17036/g.45331  ORF Transcript_17036/g.45331 Transcript_17036/m.45331 type:complete len:292 (+) Transcript_17036:42-917(+)
MASDADSAWLFPRWLWMPLPFLLVIWSMSIVNAGILSFSVSLTVVPNVMNRSFWIICPVPGVLLWQHSLYVLAFLPGKLVWERALQSIVQWAAPSKRRLTHAGFGMLELAYLCVNNFTELTVILHSVAFAISDDVSKHPSDIGFWNTIASFAICFLGFDFLYALWHRVMHQPWLYAWVHKHHHQQVAPHRGWYDTASMTPAEHCSTLLIFLMVPRISASIVGLHAVAYAVFVLLWYSLEVANHLPNELSIRMLGYSSSAHHAHHRHLTCNYGTLSCFADRVLGSFREHRSQ